MHNNSIAKVAIALPLDQEFDYSIPQRLADRARIGMRVKIIFGKRYTTGYIVDLCSKTKIKELKPLIDLLEVGPVFTEFNLCLAKKIRDYYICSLGEALDIMLPNVLKRAKNIRVSLSYKRSLHNDNKKAKVIYIQNFFEEKTLNYFKDEIIKKIAEKRRILLVVPQIKSAKEIYDYFSKIEGIKIAVWHTELSKMDMLNLWNDLAHDKIDMVIGSRSSIFAPLKNLGLIIIKDENDILHKDDQVPYYHTVKIAQMRSEIEGCDIILSSFIPSAQTYHQLIANKKNKYNIFDEIKALPDMQFTRLNFTNKINAVLEREIESALEKKEKILILLNQKGFATFISCRRCNEILKCARCSSNLRFDYLTKDLICPWCNFKTKLVEICPSCNSSYVKFGGLGMTKLESNLKRIFPAAIIITLDELIRKEEAPNYDITIATKKILNFPNLKPDISIIWNLDSLLNVGNFKTTEETYQLLSRLLLRTKRKMIICSSLNSEFYLLKTLRDLDFNKFYNSELKLRRNLNLPPYCHLGLVSVRSLNKRYVESESNKIYHFIERLGLKDIEVSSPYESLRSKFRDKYYKYLAVKSKNIKLLNRIFKKTLKKFRRGNVIITVNIDPV